MQGGGGGGKKGDRAPLWRLLNPSFLNQIAMATTTSRGSGSPYRRRDGEPVLEHRPGSVFVLLGEDDVLVIGGSCSRLLPEPPLCVTTTNLVGGVVCGCGWVGSCCLWLNPPEPGWLTLVCGAGVPWYATSALP